MKTKNKFLRVITLLPLCLVLLGMFAVFYNKASAMVVRSGEEYKLDKHSTLEDDLYVVAVKNLSLFGSTTGDVFAGGTNVDQTGTIGQDALLLGGTVNVDGAITGDVRVIGGDITVKGTIDEDAVLIGGSVKIDKSAVIKGDVFVIADYFILEGEVDGLVEIHAKAGVIKGKVGKGVGATVKESLSITGDSVIGGNVTYKAPIKAVISDTSHIEGNVTYEEVQQKSTASGFNFNAFGFMMHLLILVISATFLVYFFPSQSKKMVDIAVEGNAVSKILKGLLLLFVWLIANMLLIVFTVTIIPGTLLMLVYIFAVIVASMLSPVIAGVVLARWFKKPDEEMNLAWVSFGAIVLVTLTLLPVVGALVRIMLFLLAFYSVSIMLYIGVWEKRNIVACVKESDYTEDINEEENEE